MTASSVFPEDFMRDQYAGDVSDLLKFAFLRTLAAEDKTVGVGWYYNPAHDGRPDGRHREYCDEPKWKSLDLALWNALRELPERSLNALEKLPIWPLKTPFYRVPVPSTRSRQSWAMDMKSVLQESSIVFLDPDNGVGVSERHTTVDEIEAMRQPGRAVVLIKFPARENHDRQLDAYHGLLGDQTGAMQIVTVRTRVWLQQPSFRWFTIIDADDALVERAKQFARRLNGIEKCSADVVCVPRSVERREKQIRMSNRSTLVQSPPQSLAADRVTTVENVCPECGHQFKGNGFDGIDRHWRAKHEAIMSYKEAWPLVKSGNYHRNASTSI
jgi:hypothetical protein